MNEAVVNHGVGGNCIGKKAVPADIATKLSPRLMEKTLASTPRAVRQQIDAQIERLAQAKGVALRKTNASVPGGIAMNLRLAALHGHGAIVTLKRGKQISGDVYQTVLEPVPMVQLHDGTRLASIPIKNIVELFRYQ